MAVRSDALGHFGLTTIREGRPLATLEEVLVPLYLGHRYQVEAAVKLRITSYNVCYTKLLRERPAGSQQETLLLLHLFVARPDGDVAGDAVGGARQASPDGFPRESIPAYDDVPHLVGQLFSQVVA